MSLEAIGLAEPGKGADFVLSGRHAPDGEMPTNLSGGLVGFGHYTGGTGVRQAVDIWMQLTGKAGDCQIKINPNRRYGLLISMGGNDRTVTACVFKKTG
jgi:acetyl-CoA C-acetyltransferase/acetyl-CoA acyltransferase